jgi:hypothetical protein
VAAAVLKERGPVCRRSPKPSPINTRWPSGGREGGGEGRRAGGGGGGGD